jgi:cytochrome P450
VALLRPFLGTAVQDYVGGEPAANSLKFTRLANAHLAERVEAEERATESGRKMRSDLLHHVLHARDAETGKGLTKEELQADSFLLLTAGSDNVAIVIAACVFYLLRSPSAHARLTAEIRSAFSSADEIRTPAVNGLPYLTACIQETLRMSPPIPGSLPRLVLPGGLTIPHDAVGGDDGTVGSNGLGAIHVPAGTTVGVPAYAIHHNEAYYPDSWSFRPERWIDSADTPGGPAGLARARKAYCPFSTGPGDCVAKNLAYLAFRLALAHLLWRYDVRLATAAPGEGANAAVQRYSGLRDASGAGDLAAREEGRRRVAEYQMVDFIVGYRDGPMVELREREGVRPGDRSAAAVC